MGSKYKHLFSEFEIRGVTFKNRIEMAPTSPKFTTENGYMTTEHIEYFRPIARGGAAIITLGNCSIDIASSQDEPRQVGIDSDDYIPALTRLTDMFDCYDVVGQLEINHSGLDSIWKYNRTTAYGPSRQMMPKELALAMAEGRQPIYSEEMSISQIRDVVQKFIDAAWRCKQAGMKSVFVHGGHANLIGQFSSPHYNHRTDEYGGSLENRARFAIEILDGIRKKCGEDFVIGMRVSADEMIPDGMHYEETREYIQLLDGKADIFNISAGVHTDFNYFMYTSPNMYMPHMINVKYAADLKRILRLSKISVVGGIPDLTQAEKILADGHADFCAMARPLMADPEMPRKYALGIPEDVRPCTRCNYCGKRISTSRTVACAVNPHLGREFELSNGLVKKATVRKKVLVVGGGPGGMQTTLTLLERGHEVILLEKNNRLGGNLHAAAAMHMKVDMQKYLKYITDKVSQCDADIRLNTTATPDIVQDLNPDALVIAVGATPSFPNVPGIDLPHVHWAADADMGFCEIGERIVIIGGGSLGLECAVTQSGRGKSVTVLELLPHIPSSITLGTGQLCEIINKNGGRILTARKLLSVDSDKIACKNIETGEIEIHSCNTVLFATGLVPRKAMIRELRHAIPETETYIIGDARHPDMIGDAIRGGFNAAITI